MEFTKKQPAFIYLDKNGFYFFENGMTQVISLAFLATSVKDMDVINGGSLVTQIKGFIDQYKVTPASITIIFSPNITFEKDLVGLAHEQQEEEIKKFLETVPFDSVLSKEYPIDKGIKVIAGNDDIYMELKMAFEKNASSVDNAVPYQMMGQDQVYIRNLTPDNAIQLLKRLDHLKQVSMLTVEKEKFQPMEMSSQKKGEIKTKKVNVRLFAMIGIFGILFIVLGIMLLNMK